MLILLIHNNKVGHRINKWVAESTKWVTESTKWVTESTNGVITESTKWVWGTVSYCFYGEKKQLCGWTHAAEIFIQEIELLISCIFIPLILPFQRANTLQFQN